MIKDFKRLLKQAMLDGDFTQKELAEKMGLKQEQISSWLNGKRNPSERSLKKIAQATGKSLNFFLKNSDVYGNIVGDENTNNAANIEAINIMKKYIQHLEEENQELKKNLKKQR